MKVQKPEFSRLESCYCWKLQKYQTCHCNSGIFIVVLQLHNTINQNLVLPIFYKIKYDQQFILNFPVVWTYLSEIAEFFIFLEILAQNRSRRQSSGGNSSWQGGVAVRKFLDIVKKFSPWLRKNIHFNYIDIIRY